MCLRIVDEITQEYLFGYKIFFVYRGKGLRGEFFHSGAILYQLNKWIDDNNQKYLESTFDNKKYPAGFHFFPRFEDAVRWYLSSILSSAIKELTNNTNSNPKIYRVEVKNCRASGYQNSKYLKVGVAGSMKIIKEMNILEDNYES